MCHVVNVQACTTSGFCIQYVVPCTQSKCSSTLARFGPSFPPVISMLPGVPIVFSGTPGAPPAPYSAMQSAGALQGTAVQPMVGAPWPIRPCLMLVHLWPLQLGQCKCLVTCLGPRHSRPLCKLSLKSLPGNRQRQDLEARELEIQRMTRTRNLNAVRDARVMTATSVAGSRHSRKKEQAPRHASSQIASQRSLTPSGAPFRDRGH